MLYRYWKKIIQLYLCSFTVSNCNLSMKISMLRRIDKHKIPRKGNSCILVLSRGINNVCQYEWINNLYRFLSSRICHITHITHVNLLKSNCNLKKTDIHFINTEILKTNRNKQIFGWLTLAVNLFSLRCVFWWSFKLDISYLLFKTCHSLI